MIQIRIRGWIWKQAFLQFPEGTDSKDFSSEKTFDNKIQLSQIHVESNFIAFLGQIIFSP